MSVDCNWSCRYDRGVAVSRHTISIDPKVSTEGVKRAKALGYKKLSPYVEYLIRKDVEERPEHVRVMREEGGPWPAKRKRA